MVMVHPVYTCGGQLAEAKTDTSRLQIAFVFVQAGGGTTLNNNKNFPKNLNFFCLYKHEKYPVWFIIIVLRNYCDQEKEF